MTKDIFPEFYQMDPTEPEMRFAHFWVELYPEIDLHFQYPLEGYKRSKYDFAHVPSKTGIDIQGGNWVQGMGHTSPTGVSSDAKKQRRAISRNWALVPIMGDDVESADKLSEIFELIRVRTN